MKATRKKKTGCSVISPVPLSSTITFDNMRFALMISDGTKMFLLRGKMTNVVLQAAHLRSIGIAVRTSPLCHVTNRADYHAALTAFFAAGVPGWSAYQADMITENVCTSEEFFAALKSSEELARTC
jgi:hypothetical protein